jgi:hypothetical protein
MKEDVMKRFLPVLLGTLLLYGSVPASTLASAWERVWGPTEQVVVDSESGAVYALPKTGPAIRGTKGNPPDIYRWDGKPSAWTSLGMPTKQVKHFVVAGWKPNSNLFALSSSGQVYRFKGTPGSWELLGAPGGTQAGELYGGPDRLLASNAKTGEIYSWQGKPNAWRNLSTKQMTRFKTVAVGKSSDVEFKTQIYGLLGSDAPASVQGVHQWTGASWYRRGNLAGNIYASGTRLFATNPTSGDLMSLYPTGWRKVGAPGKMFAPDGKGGIYGLSAESPPTTTKGVFRWKGTPNAWEQIGGAAGKVFAGGNLVFVTDVKTGDLYHYNPPPTGPGGLVVVAPQKFHSALEDFIKHKYKLGLPTTLVALEQALKTSTGVDDAERLKRYLYNEWKARKIRYALLVGDVDVLPVRYMVVDRITPEAFDYAFYPSDLYYADLARPDGSFDDWNARKDGFHSLYFGEVRGHKNKSGPINFDKVTYHPKIAVGRWPVNTVAEVKLVAGKTMAYENGVLARNKPGMKRAALIVPPPMGLEDGRPMMDGIAAKLPSGWTAEKRYFRDNNPKYKTPEPTTDQLRDLLNGGLGLMMHFGHGAETFWWGCLDLPWLSKVSNADRLPIMISGGCDTAFCATLAPYFEYVDYKGVTHKGTSNGEVFKAPPPAPAIYQKRPDVTSIGVHVIRGGPGGAVAYIGCNTGAQTSYTLLEGFGDGLSKAANRRLGDCWIHAVVYYYDKQNLATIVPDKSWYPPCVFYQAMKFMVFGDPSLLIPGK